MKKAKLIALEGADGLGKSTQVNLLARALRHDNKRVATVKLPRYDRLTGKLILRMLKSGSAVRYPNVFQLIQWLDKMLFQLFYVSSLLRDNDYVIFDRWHASMWAYGCAAGANESLTDRLVKTLKEPDVVLIFHGNSKRIDKQDAYEANASYQKRVALHYILWACTHANVHVINADHDVEQVNRAILEHVRSL
jgi:dTMP kinase